jgi:hypothetical protein
VQNHWFLTDVSERKPQPQTEVIAGARFLFKNTCGQLQSGFRQIAEGRLTLGVSSRVRENYCRAGPDQYEQPRYEFHVPPYAKNDC